MGVTRTAAPLPLEPSRLNLSLSMVVTIQVSLAAVFPSTPLILDI